MTSQHGPAAEAPLAVLLRDRSEQIAQQWAGLSLFRTVFTVTRDEAVEAGRTIALALAAVAESGRPTNLQEPGFAAVRDQLGNITAARSRAGLSTTEVDGEVVALRDTAWHVLREDLAPLGDEERHRAEVLFTELASSLRLVVLEAALADGQELIDRQRQQLMELSTPVIRVWDRVVAVPLIGTLDSARSQVVMEGLLQAVVDEKAAFAILDITGVPTVDTLVAQHLIKTVMATRLMGAECIVSGIRPAIAQTIVQLGIDLEGITTRATLSDALQFALRRLQES